LRLGHDFDCVVLGVGLGAVPHVASELVARSERWRAMVQSVETVATRSFQVWMNEEMADLGWSADPPNIAGFSEPFDTWADMRQLIADESFDPHPKALAYFCSVLPTPTGIPSRADQSYPERERERVFRDVERFLSGPVAGLWPRAVAQDGSFRWELLVDPDGGGSAAGPDRLRSQFWTANINPSDRYVLSVPGTTSHRISPLATGFDNLTVCGDWTDNRLNCGCVEAAVMSGLLAAYAISGSPRPSEIIGYNHP
jgi:hypothetical protein